MVAILKARGSIFWNIHMFIFFQCRQESWVEYHQYECTCLDLLHSVGIAHLAVRTIFTAGMKKLIELKSALKNGDEDNPEGK